MRDLKDIRVEIDAIDRQIVELFEQRMALTSQVAEYKIATGKAVFDAAREEEKLNAAASMVHSSENAEAVRELFTDIMAISRKQQHALIRKNEGETNGK